MGEISGSPFESLPFQNDYRTDKASTLENSYSESSTTPWTRHQDKLFERALVTVPENSPNRWLKIASLVPGKSAAEVRDHYDALVLDLMRIDSGRVELPSYVDFSAASSPETESVYCDMEKASSRRSDEGERKKGKPWTRKEHQLFLLGLKKFGKGDWRSISRNLVVTRTPTQVASHAQKYFLRQESVKKDRKRSSIHDITTVDGNLAPPTPPPPTAIAANQNNHYNQFSSVLMASPSPLPPPLLPPQLIESGSVSYISSQRTFVHLEY